MIRSQDFFVQRWRATRERKDIYVTEARSGLRDGPVTGKSNSGVEEGKGRETPRKKRELGWAGRTR